MLLDVMEDLVEEVVEGVCGVPPEVKKLREACPDMPKDVNNPSTHIYFSSIYFLKVLLRLL